MPFVTSRETITDVPFTLIAGEGRAVIRNVDLANSVFVYGNGGSKAESYEMLAGEALEVVVNERKDKVILVCDTAMTADVHIIRS